VLAGRLSGQAQAGVVLRTEPAHPTRGTLVRLIVAPDHPTERPWSWVDGSVAGEPLHFLSSGDETFRALAGIPVDGSDSLPVLLLVSYGDGSSDSIHAAVPVRRLQTTMEHLRVAPAMAEPDSAATARIRSETERAHQVGRQSHATPQLWSDRFEPPRTSRITSTFGTGRDLNGRVLSRHLGTDFAGAVGDPVQATNRGVVVLVADFYLSGRTVYLDHGSGLVSAYFHLSESNVVEGDTVARGQVIGKVGQSGRVTGPHLHWVVRYGNVTIDPMSVLALLGPATPPPD
jgi:murein DD-endopeptidase MepM/ murein hydrolase activator NlpD